MMIKQNFTGSKWVLAVGTLDPKIRLLPNSELPTLRVRCKVSGFRAKGFDLWAPSLALWSGLHVCCQSKQQRCMTWFLRSQKPKCSNIQIFRGSLCPGPTGGAYGAYSAVPPPDPYLVLLAKRGFKTTFSFLCGVYYDVYSPLRQNTNIKYKLKYKERIETSKNNKEKPTVPTDKHTRQGSTNTSIQIHKNTRYSNK